MNHYRELLNFRGKTVYDQNGEKIGKMDDIYLDNETQEPEWFSVGSGMFNTKHMVVPVQGYSAREDGLQVPYSKDLIKDSPSVDSDEIAPDREYELFEYYGIREHHRDLRSVYGSDDSRTKRDRQTIEHPRGSSDVSTLDRGHTYRDTDGDDQTSVVRHEEQLRVGTRETEAGRVRLRKWVETEPVSEDVQVRRETVRVEREPLNEAVTDAEIGEREIDVTLRREEPVVQKEVVAKERISLEKNVEQRTERVEADLARERVEVDGDVNESAPGDGRSGKRV